MNKILRPLIIALSGGGGLLVGLLTSSPAAFAFDPTKAGCSGFVTNKTRRGKALYGGYDATVVGGVHPSTPLQFFTTPGNTCPYAARTFIVLKELDIPFDMTEISGNPKPDWYLNTINPRGKVPAIRMPSLPGTTTLMPEDPMMRASIRLLNDHCDNVLTPAQFTFLMNKDESKHDELCQKMEDALMTYETALEENQNNSNNNNGGDGDGDGGPYLMGQDFTLADVHVLPFLQRLVVSLRHFKKYELPRDKFPRLLDWYDLCCTQRESVKAASLTEEEIIEIYTMFVNIDYKFGGLNKN